MEMTPEEREAMDRHADAMLSLFLTSKPRPEDQGLFFCKLMDEAAREVLGEAMNLDPATLPHASSHEFFALACGLADQTKRQEPRNERL